jgi:hypothetical protein
MNYRELVDAERAGRENRYAWRKNPSAVTTAGIWYDLATAQGTPKAKNWFDATPLTAAQVSFSADRGMFHGYDVSPYTKYLRLTTVMANAATALPMGMILCDYLLYYPTIDDSELEPQVMDNTVTLPRYTDGVGVQMMAVTLSARTGGQSFYVTYTNSDGVSGRVSQTVVQNTSTVVGTITTSVLTPTTNSSGGPFIGLQKGDSGVRSIDSVQMLGGDVGLFALVLVKPLAQTQIREITAPNEVDYYLKNGEIPQIYNDAYLNWLCLPNGSLAATALSGDLKVIWN